MAINISKFNIFTQKKVLMVRFYNKTYMKLEVNLNWITI